MPKQKQMFQVRYNVDLNITYEVEAADRDEAIRKARSDGRVVNEAWESCDLDHVEQVTR